MNKLLVLALLGAASARAQTPAPSAQAAAPAPASQSAGAVKDRLSQSDITAVVIANKAAITKCVNEQKRKDPAINGTMVVRWTVQPSGKTTGVAVQTAAYKSTYLANCITTLVRGWTFPVSRTASAPIDFPFTF